jgi:calcineurin-like phosphoesterase family protein
MASSSLTKNLNKTIEEPIKEDEVWILSDTECKADKKVCYTWTSSFQEF